MSRVSRVALVIISHSEKLAEGVQELARQMAPNVTILPAGGRDDGGIGTSFDRVSQACDAALAASEGAGVIILTDLGSANMVAESVIEFADEPEKLVLVDVPLVESAVVAAVAAEQGDNLEAVLRQVSGATHAVEREAPVEEPDLDKIYEVSATAKIADGGGLHARPAAELVKMANVFDAEVRIDDADGKSLMEVIALGRKYGETVTVSATGPQANEAVANLVSAIKAGFDR